MVERQVVALVMTVQIRSVTPISGRRVMVTRLVWDQVYAGSSPVAPTTFGPLAQLAEACDLKSLPVWVRIPGGPPIFGRSGSNPH